jgi:putative NIF3 family GTP cyclohydrolase 1 type 2
MKYELTGWAVDSILNAAVGSPTSTAMYEGICAGNAQSVVRGAVVCYAPTLDVLRRAAAEERNLIISREHPFYLHGGVNYGYATGGLEAALKDDPVVAAKREIINTNRMIAYRFGAAWDNFRPNAQSIALARAFGLKPVSARAGERFRGVTCDLPRTTMTALARTAAERLKVSSPRVVGDLNASVTRVAVLAGETDPKQELARLLSDPKVDGVIAGAGGIIDEVDGALSYFQDVIASGRKVSLLAIGYGPSQNPGCEDMARWIRTALPDVDVVWWPVTDPSWIPGA